MDRWQNKIAVVTGAAAGIGAAITRELLGAGLVVVGLDLSLERLQALKSKLEIDHQSNFHTLKCDVTKQESVNEAFDWIENNLHGIDILVNNAGCCKSGQLCTMDVALVQQVLQTNVMGVVYCTQRAFKSMKERNFDGHVVLINSIKGHKVFDIMPGPMPHSNIYASSKFAITAINEVYRQEFKALDTKIKITSISPGYVDTGIVPVEIKGKVALLQPEDIAQGVLYAISTPPHVQIHELTIKIAGETLDCLPDGRATCRSVPGLTKDQLELCYKASDVTAAALEGLDLAIRECQTQFQWHRWNCSSLSTKSRNPHASNLLKKGYRESAFAFAISAAGVAHSVARACSQGRLISCGCDPSVNRKTLNKNLRQSLEKERKLFLQYMETNQILSPEDEKKYERAKIASRWKWGGCSHNMDFGVEFSKLFLDCREKAGDIQSKINLHNNHAGRMAVSNNMEFRCKCHGMSGSCQLKTCWKSAPDFHVVGKVLKHQFRRAILVDQSNLGNGEPIVVLKRARNKKSNSAANTERSGERNERPTRKTVPDKNAQRASRKLETALFYYQRSPNFCERDLSADIQGTVGRKCNRNSTVSDGCNSLCCGRGYSLVKEKRAERCRCRFQWCCSVECDECHVEEWISVCN